MKTPCLYSLLILAALLAGCSRSPRNVPVYVDGFFTLTNNAGTVYWASYHDSTTNEMRFVLLLPDSEQIGPGGSQGGADYFYMKAKRDGHEWKIGNDVNQKPGTRSLQFSDLTANSVTNIDLVRSRIWQISDDKILTPLKKVDPIIAEKISDQVKSTFKSNPMAE